MWPLIFLDIGERSWRQDVHMWLASSSQIAAPGTTRPQSTSSLASTIRSLICSCSFTLREAELFSKAGSQATPRLAKYFSLKASRFDDMLKIATRIRIVEAVNRCLCLRRCTRFTFHALGRRMERGKVKRLTKATPSMQPATFASNPAGWKLQRLQRAKEKNNEKRNRKKARGVCDWKELTAPICLVFLRAASFTFFFVQCGRMGLTNQFCLWLLTKKRIFVASAFWSKAWTQTGYRSVLLTQATDCLLHFLFERRTAKCRASKHRKSLLGGSWTRTLGQMLFGLSK